MEHAVEGVIKIVDIINDKSMKKTLLLVLISVLFIACQRGVVFSKFQSLPKQGWAADSVLTFIPNITDTIQGYDVQVIVRHTDKYTYQNLWLFVDVRQGSNLLHRDTIEGMLANERGEWNGKGRRTHELPLLYLENIKFPYSGDYEVTIQQGMREDILLGITDIGLKIIKHGQK